MSFVRLPYRLWMVALAGVLGAGGFGFSLAFTGSAAALEVPTITASPLPVPVPTVTAPLPTPMLPAPTPTVPAPTVPVPAPTVPAPTPTVSVPGVSVPTSPSAPAPVTSSPGSLSGGSPSGSVVLLGSGGTDPGGASGSSVAGGSAAAPISRSGATTRGIQVTNVHGRKGAVRIVFRLARPGRVVVIVRGPLPDCSRVARFVIQGRRGENALRFNAHTGGRRLAEGSYLVGLRPVRAALTRWGALLVDASGARALTRSAAGSAVAHCSSAPVGVTPFAIGFLAGTERGDTLPVGRAAGAAGEQGGSATSTAVERPRSAGVLGVQKIEDAVDAIHPVVGIVFLALVIGSLLGIVCLVVSFLRGEGIARPRL